jgi:HSP20 family protein
MTLVKFNNKGANALMPGFSDVFGSIFNDGSAGACGEYQ